MADNISFLVGPGSRVVVDVAGVANQVESWTEAVEWLITKALQDYYATSPRKGDIEWSLSWTRDRNADTEWLYLFLAPGQTDDPKIEMPMLTFSRSDPKRLVTREELVEEHRQGEEFHRGCGETARRNLETAKEIS